jgi:diguanylate cyclase (GGDEF)-like protein
LNALGPAAAALSPQQIELLWGACAESATQGSAERACRRLADRMAEIIGAPVVVFRRDVAPWKMVIQAGNPAPATMLPQPDTLEAANGKRATIMPVAGDGAVSWTSVRIADHRGEDWMLALPGNWQTPEFEWLPRFVETATLSVGLAASRGSQLRCENLAAVGYAVSRKLGQITDERELHQFVLDAAAKVVTAERGTLARYRHSDGKLTMTATLGYPRESVEHVRLTPGNGLVGGVFTSKKPLLVRDLARIPWMPGRRQRYKTRSFMAVPLLAGTDGVGVITLADRADGAPFDRADLVAVRMIAAPAALALSRQRLIQQTEELAHLAAVDPLTGLFNRRYLQTRLAGELERARRGDTDLAVMMVDIDQFKTINDLWGHGVGDLVIQHVSDILRRSVRLSDVCTRYGGDEFAIVVPESAHTAPQSAERIRQRIEAYLWRTVAPAVDVQITVSVGVAIAERGESADDLVARADRFLYQAKAAGRNCMRPAEVIG